MNIEVITYEQSRLEFFKAKRDMEVKRYEKFKKSKAIKELPTIERMRMESEIGERISYWNDVIELLENSTADTAKERTNER